MSSYLDGFKNKNFLRLWLAQIISQFGDRINQLALVGLVAERFPGSAVDLAKLMSFTILPVFVIQPFAGVLVDRWDRRTTLFVCDVLRGLLVFSIAWIFMDQHSMVPIYIAVFLAFCFSRFYVPAKMSIIPDLVEEKHLLMANSLMTTTGMIAFVLGAALGGFIVDQFGSRAGLMIDGTTFFVSAVFLFSIRMTKNLKIDKEKILRAKDLIKTAEKSMWMEIKEGLHYLISHREIRFIMGMLFTLLSAAGSVYVVIIVFIQQSFHSVTKHLGVLAVCLGIGLFLGVLAYGRWGKKIAWYKTIFYCLMAGGLMLVVFTLMVHHFPNIFLAMGLAVLLGIIVGPVFIASNTVVHLVSDDSMRGKVFSALEVVIHFAFLVAMFISSWLSQYVSPGSILKTVGMLIFFIGILGLVRTRSGLKVFPEAQAG
jgi:MFS family permease